ncbi:unnamed protein product [Ilex paraguariensis]|uniref:Uncharacterized protein n=1 Tax=Ilex paraguariensis TaxID=185542 RepID=A0ABC8R0Y5_9AQUA
MTLGLINANAVVHAVWDIRDPEHPYSLEQLSVLSEESITVDEKLGRIFPSVEATLNVTNVALLANTSFHYHLPVLSMTLARPSTDALTIGIPELACVISAVMLTSCYHCDHFVSMYC